MYLPVYTRCAFSFLPAAALFYTGYGLSFANGAHVQRLWKRAVIPMHIARFAVQPPDSVVLMPVKDAYVEEVRNTWHASRGKRKHEGTDIFAPRGTPVYSATNGVVVRITSKTIGGKSVFVAGAGNRRYYYTHLDRYARGMEVGDLVTPTSVLGYVGNTGNARRTPSHLHFGIYGSRGAINPLPLLANRE